MGGSTKKVLRRTASVLAMATIPGAAGAMLTAGMIKNKGDVNKAVDDTYNLYSKSSDDKPAEEQAPNVTGALQTAVEEEDAKRRKKRGFSANVLTNEFRFGGTNTTGV